MKEKITDNRNRTIGYIDRKLNGECIIYDSRNLRIGILKPIGSKLYAYDKANRRMGYWDEGMNITYDANMRRIGNGNLLLSFYFIS